MKDCLGQDLNVGDLFVKPSDGIIGVIVAFTNHKRVKFINLSFLNVEFKGHSGRKPIVKITEDQLISHIEERYNFGQVTAYQEMITTHIEWTKAVQQKVIG